MAGSNCSADFILKTWMAAEFMWFYGPDDVIVGRQWWDCMPEWPVFKSLRTLWWKSGLTHYYYAWQLSSSISSIHCCRYGAHSAVN